MGYDLLYDQSWDLYKKEMMVNSLDSMMMGKIISTFLDRGYYLLRLNTVANTIRSRFDKGKLERVRVDLTMHNLDLGDLYSFGGISHLTVWMGVQRDLSGFLGGQVKEALSMVRGSPEPGVYMVMQDGTSYFVGTTVYFNVKRFCNLDTYTVDVDEIMEIIDDVLEEIKRMDANLEVV